MVVRPQTISGMELEATLKALGWTLDYEAGSHRVFVSPDSRERAVPFESKWDMPVKDVDRFLWNHGISAEAFWREWNKLYHS